MAKIRANSIWDSFTYLCHLSDSNLFHTRPVPFQNLVEQKGLTFF
jgi:hypothetical protein